MCRFLVIDSKKNITVKNYLTDFSKMCKKSERFQGEGWSIVWKEGGEWSQYKSVKSKWEDKTIFNNIPTRSTYIIHARGASFQKHKDFIGFNQPFISKENIFAFNGFINGVSIPYKVKGDIGSEKIFNLYLLLKNKYQDPTKALENLNKIITNNAKIIEAMNVCIINNGTVSTLCRYSDNKDYFTIQYKKTKKITIISSAEFGDHKFNNMENNQILKFNLYNNK